MSATPDNSVGQPRVNLEKPFKDRKIFTNNYFLIGEPKSEIPYQLIPPKETSLVVLPTVKGEVQKVRYGMHTDKIGDLFRFLSSLRYGDIKLKDLMIEGRVLDYKQWERLQYDKQYRFFLEGRSDRADSITQADTIRFFFPKGMKLTFEDVKRLLSLSYSPATSSDSNTIKDGYVSADFLLKAYERDYHTNSFLPLWGGCNEFHIGSDVLTPLQLKTLSLRMRKDFGACEAEIAKDTASISPEALQAAYDTFEVPLTVRAQALIYKVANATGLRKDN